jgi:hypothetical protein
MKRTLTVMVLGILLALLFTQVALADQVFITHETTGTVVISPGDGVTFRVYWYAGSPGLVQEAIRCSSITVQLRGTGVDFYAGPPLTKLCWGPVQPAPADVVATFLRAHNHGKTPVSLAYWQIALPTENLGPGDYDFDWTWAINHRTVDLGDWDGDGHIDHYGLPDVIEGGCTLRIPQ